MDPVRDGNVECIAGAVADAVRSALQQAQSNPPGATATGSQQVAARTPLTPHRNCKT